MMAAPPMLQPYDPTRGVISCFTEHGLPGDPISTATGEALRDILVDHYQEAFRRLPVEDVPDGVDLAQLLDRGGLCLGLLDPVTNIVLNTVSHLPDDFDESPSPPAPLGVRSSIFTFKAPSSRGRGRSSRASWHAVARRSRAPSTRSRGERSRDSWHDVARRSSLALLEFMRAYFGLLTQEQAGRYLVWARADLAMAVLLVEHELYAARAALPDPRSGRTRNSLRLAATIGKLPLPDQLVSLATAWLPPERLDMLAPVLRSRDRLTVHDVKTVLQVLRHQDDFSAMKTMPLPPAIEEERATSCVDLGDGRIAYTIIVQRAGDHIASLRRPQDMNSTLSSYAATPVPPGTTKDSPCALVRSLDADADSCPYVRSLEMSLYGAIHGFYLRALAMLPSHVARQHVRGVLLAGHCYGPMDPVSNIVLSAIWYDVNFPLRGTQAHDILDTLTLLRAVSRSLHGLVALLHATSGQKLPLHEILKYLCYTQCDISAMLQPLLHPDGSCPAGPFEAATAAAQHPQASAMATLFASLAPAKLDRLRSLMKSATANNAPLSQESLTQVYSILREETSELMIPRQPLAPKLCSTALSILARKREAYDHQQRFIRARIEKLLQGYARGHPSEPKYNVDFICGVALTNTPSLYYGNGRCYHINFMAATKSSLRNTLFFAEFSGAYDDQSKKSICCPLPQPYDMGRCYYGRESARKIMYPDHPVDYFSSDITRGGLDAIEDTLDTDFLYFDSERDVELTKELQRMAKQQEVKQRSTTEMFSQWASRAPLC